jgi:two-component system chemotaxis response regulator CheY
MPIDLTAPVLIVDDYNLTVRIIRNLLRQLGFERIDDAHDGLQALAKMRERKYSLVISDWNVEPMTGYDLLQKVRSDPNISATPFIVVTTDPKIENAIVARDAGISGCIVKPFNAQTLKSKIETVFPDVNAVVTRCRHSSSDLTASQNLISVECQGCVC